MQKLTLKNKSRRVLIISAPAPQYLCTITISTAKIINALLKDGWKVDVVGFKEKKGIAQADDILSSLIQGARIFESESLLGRPSTWVFPAIKIGRKLSKNNSYDLIFSIAPHTWTHVVALFLKLKLNVPWVTYFCDPWGNNPDLKFRSIRRFLELRTLIRCDAVVYSNHLLKDWALSQYISKKTMFEKKSFLIPYFYDATLYPKVKNSRENGKFIIRHMGQVPIGGSIITFLHGIKKLFEERHNLSDELVFEFFGRVDPVYKGSVDNLVKSLGLGKNIKFVSDSNKVIHLPYVGSLGLMQEADALLLLGVHPSHFHGFGNTILHVKLIDYLGAGKPIFALTSEGSITQELLGDIVGVCTSDNPVAIKEALAKFIAGLPLPLQETREQFSKDRIYPLWQEVFNKVIKIR